MNIEPPIEAKIAKNPEQAFWIELREKCQKAILTHEREIIINKSVVALARDMEEKNGK